MDQAPMISLLSIRDSSLSSGKARTVFFTMPLRWNILPVILNLLRNKELTMTGKNTYSVG